MHTKVNCEEIDDAFVEIFLRNGLYYTEIRPAVIFDSSVNCNHASHNY